jgi:hypothetical protein
MSKAVTPISIQHCDCISPAVALLHHGSFPTNPIKASTWAFDIKFLEFASSYPYMGAQTLLHYPTLLLHSYCGVESKCLYL